MCQALFEALGMQLTTRQMRSKHWCSLHFNGGVTGWVPQEKILRGTFVCKKFIGKDFPA